MKSWIFAAGAAGLALWSALGMESPLPDTRMSWLDAESPVLIRRDAIDGTIEVQFAGALESAPSAEGPWSPIPTATSPFEPDLGPDRQFFRSAVPETPGIFSTAAIAQWTVTGPLQRHFDLAFAGTPDGIFPPKREKPYFDGSITLPGLTVPASLRVRGNSSLQECPFPKLKLKVSRANREGTPFAEAREIKIGTHCADGGRGGIGRLRDERATYREALAYEAMELLGFLSPRVRRARIEFHDTGSPADPNPGGWIVTRNAVLLEDPEVVAERLGGTALGDDDIAALENARFGIQLITDLRFLHVFLGNWDFRLSEDGRGLWNTDVIRRADGTLVPLAGDFDLSSWVTEFVRAVPPRDYHPELPDRDRQVRYELEALRREVPAALFDAARARFEGHRTGLDSLVAAAVVDDAGRTNAAAHVVTFFDGLTAVVTDGRKP
ncbi:MAG: hypothetical protein JNL10_11315 [Verrucomicrobiales bacterium]|nr:hypothetical protein [Verrucomicrobiales bacterium]